MGFDKSIKYGDVNRMNDDIISRQGAINAIENTDCELLPCEWNELTNAIMQWPSAERKGQWVGANEYAKHLTEETGNVYTVSSMETDRLFCNQCWKPGGKLKTNYCPHCGAKMGLKEG